jgi:hypothetical protein
MTSIREYLKSFSFSLGNLILGAIVAAIVAGFIGAYNSRPRLRVAIFAPNLAEVVPDEESDQIQVSAASNIMQECGRSLWIICFDSADNLRQYLKEIKAISALLQSKIEEIPPLRNAVVEWPKQVSDKNSLAKVYEILRENEDIVMFQVILEVRQGMKVFHKPKPYKGTRLPYYVLKEDDDGDFFVLSGTESLSTRWTTYPMGGPKKELKETFARFAEAVTYDEEDDLNDIHSVIERILAAEGEARNYRVKLEAEINSYSRWTIQTIITNSGRDPISLSPHASLYVSTQGQKYVDSQGMQSALDGDYRIEMTNTVDTGTLSGNNGGGFISMTQTPLLRNSDSPIVIDGGHATSVTFRSIGRVRELQNGPVVLDFYRKRNLKCVLATLSITSTPSTFGSPGLAWSKPIAFSDASFEELFPKNAVW